MNPLLRLIPSYRPDPASWLLMSAGALLTLGLIMVASASMDVANVQFGHPFYFVIRHGTYIAVGVSLAVIIYKIPVHQIQEKSTFIFMSALILLILLLIPHVGRRVNGSLRWIGIGGLTIQPSELAKIAMVMFMSAFLVRRRDEVRESWSGLIKAAGVLGLTSVLLMFEPDFGATVVVLTTSAIMLWLAGSGAKQTAISVVLGVFAAGILAVSSSYRVQRLTAYVHPWAHPFDQGYQLTQSLIAFGRGGWTGLGLGNSIQKLFYLPEAHTDFVFAVFAEEFGFIGVSIAIGLFMVLVYNGLKIGFEAEKKGQVYGAYLAYGLSVLIGLQACVNMGVTSGALPTKGLTLPLVSYGGSSLVVELGMIAMLLRVRYETLLMPQSGRGGR